MLITLVAGAGVLDGDVLAITLTRGAGAFIGSAIVLFMTMVFLTPYIFALLAELDETGRWASMGPGFLLTGVALGPGIAGVLRRGADFTMLGCAALACICVALALLFCAQRLRTRRYLLPYKRTVGSIRDGGGSAKSIPPR